MRPLLLALLLWAGPAAAQEAAGTGPPAEEASEPAPAPAEGAPVEAPAEAPGDGSPAEGAIADGAIGGLDLAAWADTAARAEALLESGRGSAFAVARLREEIAGWRERFGDAQAANAGRVRTVEAQLAALGEPPGEGGTEDEAVAARRAALGAELARLRAPRALAAEAYAQAGGLIAELDALQRGRQTAALVTRGPSPLDPRGWPGAVEALGDRAVGLSKEVAVSVRSEARRAALRDGWPLALLFLGAAAAFLLRGRAVARAWAARLFGPPPAWAWLRGRHGAGVAAAGRATALALAPLMGLVLLREAAEATGLFGARAAALWEALPVAGAAALGADWLARRVFGQPAANPPPFDLSPGAAARAAWRLRLGGAALAARVLALAFLGAREMEPETRALLLLPVDLLLAWALWGFGRALSEPRAAAPEAAEARRRILRWAGLALMGVAAAAPVLSLLGFWRAGGALILPTVVTVGLVGLLVALQWLATDAYAILARREDTLREALFPVAVGLVLGLLALPLLALVWGARRADLLELWTRVSDGFVVGETRVSPATFLVFATVFAGGWLVTRLLQALLRNAVLPKTRLDPGARNAAVAGLGYAGIVLAAVFAISTAGLDLSSLAIVAGALSVGIGFGLQNIVQNFVSGLILLIERPISEGDWIEVGPRMGYVRQISVRSTRIETFDRTDVIVPNGDLVSGQVVNWTRGNLVGRLILPVNVSYGTDVDLVRGILKDCAEGHPQVLLAPPPAIVVAGFGPDAVNFEIRALVRDINFGTQTRSEINEAVAKRLLAAGVRTAGSPPLPAAQPAPAPAAPPGPPAAAPRPS